MPDRRTSEGGGGGGGGPQQSRRSEKVMTVSSDRFLMLLRLSENFQEPSAFSFSSQLNSADFFGVCSSDNLFVLFSLSFLI